MQHSKTRNTLRRFVNEFQRILEVRIRSNDNICNIQLASLTETGSPISFIKEKHVKDVNLKTIS